MILNKYYKQIENKLKNIFIPKGNLFDLVIEAMNYSLLDGGKRLRPAILLEFYKICGGDKDALNFAAALEMIHTYSLIHDDLPCMDNDDFRRGKPSCHKKFGEQYALLAGDALLTEAFKLAAISNINSEYKVKAIEKLSNFSGIYGMIGGQTIDLINENKSCELSTILTMYDLKTACLLKAAATIGCILAGADENAVKKAEDYATNLGIAFQIRDDLLDYIGDESLLGKPILSDDKNNKSTYVSIVGIENAKEDVSFYSQKALKSLDFFGSKADDLRELTEFLINRDF